MLQQGESELVRRYVRDLLSESEAKFVAAKITEDDNWRNAYVAAKEQYEQSLGSNNEISTEPRKPRKFVPSKKLITIMMIGWALLAVAVIVLSIDIANRGTERRKHKEKLEVRDTLR